ncbi:type VI secretion system accessory protein TagJ [Taylorella equigenitalis]|uniref:type VI secretion system accessory protein TagJ n=1 Tax=Taylorella equigenitalis TaxID=29575 RepID=UPI0004067C97|nr:type VI secretion system accessory protein TagJ [Taylorella equigenitalis]WDU47972.1 ImpE family protein [Taylorella equigenitalis]WEE00522.1 type VI secretion system accessory protein TagJ [Taylorella equigenitalis]WEE01999.1 type VI secretion system accessory protein TagJ [Taylorella equigenitalis]WFD78535.1 type VI secretion system accessory protein TagJ [Taylorella equigenitalis]WFD80013.1 type VI secretion system accessory protein TagJ [Taylorella equigenitalis]
MNTAGIFKTNSIDEVIEQTKDKVRKNPDSADLRANLFQLLALKGDWTRAVDSLKLSAEMNSQAQPVAMLYVAAVNAEVDRQNVFQGNGRPAIFGDADEWMGYLIASIEEKDPSKSEELLDKAMELAPEVSGTIKTRNGEEVNFEWLADGDSRLGPMLEFLNNGQYGWVPFNEIESLRIIEPSGISDLIWSQAELVLTNGRSIVGMVPNRYPGDYASLDDKFNLGHRTEWVPLFESEESEYYKGVGQKTYISDLGDYPILEIESIKFNPVLTQDDAES